MIANKKKPRDTRSHNDRLNELKAIFNKKKTQALASGKINDCSLTKICHAASVSTSYMTGTKLKDESINKQYKKVAEDIVEFRRDFKGLQAEIEDSHINKELIDLKAQRDSAQSAYLEASKTIQHLKQMLEDRNKQQLRQATDIAHQGLQLQASSQNKLKGNVFSTVKVISPDRQLFEDNKYNFHDKNLRNAAWVNAKSEFESLIKRSIPTRVYLCVGMPCAGKTTWVRSSDYYSDRHPVVIDTTNLTKSDRSKWFNLIYKYKHIRDIKICAVYFEVPLFVLMERNNKRSQDRRISDIKLEEMYKRLESVDVSEDFDEIIVIRHQ